MNAAMNTARFVGQGEVCFADAGGALRTILGSCVAVTMWHPVLRCGGMCHYLLPARAGSYATTLVTLCANAITSPLPATLPPLHVALDGRFADDAIALMLREVRRRGVPEREYRIKAFGGAAMLAPSNSSESIGALNVRSVTDILRRHGLQLHAHHLGGQGHRELVFETGTGDVWMQHHSATGCATNAPAGCLEENA